MIINLHELTERSDVHGTNEGKVVYQKLSRIVTENISEETFNISLQNITASDASFFRESILSIAKQYLDEGKRFLLSGSISDDMRFNWNLAAEFKDQPIVLWTGDKFTFLGPKAGPGLSSVLDLVMKKGTITASDVATSLDISVPNASSKLKKLMTKGYISRFEQVAESGGLEFVYKSIK